MPEVSDRESGYAKALWGMLDIANNLDHRQKRIFYSVTYLHHLAQSILILSFISFVVFFISTCETKRKSYTSNPVISGDWGDPGVVKVDDDYYCVRSSFGWQPGLQIVHSKDLIHWEYIGFAYLNSSIPVETGIERYGIWGSEIGYNPNTQQFLVYAPILIQNRTDASKQTGIYVFSSDSPQGPYSEGIRVCAGIDPGFFVDDDSTLYLTNNSGKIFELSKDGKQIVRQVGQRPEINDFAPGEGPEIIKRKGMYYYICSAGGTCPYQYHKILSYRSRNLAGPWEADPENPLKYAPHTSRQPLQGPGHGELIKIRQREWYLTYHVYELSHYSLARQMCIEPIIWTDDGWWRPQFGKIPPSKIPVPNLKEIAYQLKTSDDFDSDTVGLQWFFHTKPDFSGESWSSADRKGYIRLKTNPKTGTNLSSKLQRFLLQRVTQKAFNMSTKIEFGAKSGNEIAGLLLYSDPENYILFGLSINEGKKIIEIKTKCGFYDNTGAWKDWKLRKGKEVSITKVENNIGNEIYLKIRVSDPETATFYYSADGKDWKPVQLQKPIYFGNKGKPDLGWKCGHWTGTTMGIFIDKKDSEIENKADFDFFKVEVFK